MGQTRTECFQHGGISLGSTSGLQSMVRSSKQNKGNFLTAYLEELIREPGMVRSTWQREVMGEIFTGA